MNADSSGAMLGTVRLVGSVGDVTAASVPDAAVPAAPHRAAVEPGGATRGVPGRQVP
jgi:hypothetical protein